MKRHRKRTSSILLSAFLTIAMTAVMIPAAGFLIGAADGSNESYAASVPVTFGVLESNNTVTQVNRVDLGTIDLSKADPNVENTYMIERQVCIKGAKNSGLILGNAGMSGDVDYGRGGFSGGYGQTNIDNGVPYLIANVRFNALEMKAGTYNAALEMSVRQEGQNGTYTPVDVSANGGTLVSHERVLSIPVTIKLTGINSVLTGKVSGLKAVAGNDLVTLSWNSSDPDGSFIVYRREGTETATGDNIDFSKYTPLFESTIYEKTYRDSTARNGKTYSYFVIDGYELDHAYPSNTATATPSASKVKEPLPPIFSSPDYDIGNVTLKWSLPDDNEEELAAIDHFNVYKNGNLAAQVDKNAYKESVTQYWDEEQDKTVDHHSYEWTLTLDSEPGVLFKWWVTAVSKDGVEGSPSEKYDAAAESTEPAIAGYEAWYSQYHQEEGDAVSKPAIYIKIKDASLYNAEFIKLYKKTVSQNYQFVGKIKFTPVIGSGVYDYADTAITPGTKYTYKAAVIDSKKKESEPIEFSVLAADDPGIASSTRIYYSVDENNNPCFEFRGEEGYSYKLFRNGTQINSWNGSCNDIAYVDDVSALSDGTYSYYLETSKSGSGIRSQNYRYIKDTSEKVMGKKPGAPSLSARVTGWNKNKIVLRWGKSAEGGEPDGYYIYKEVNKPVYDDNWESTGKYERGFDTDRFSESDDYISNWYMSEYPQNRYIRFRADKNTFTDEISWDYEEQFDVKYWVCAYNQYGESEIEEEQIAVFEYNNGNPKSNGDTAAPGKPIIKQVWVEPSENNGKYRDCYVTWDAPVGGRADYYTVILQKKVDGSWTEKNSTGVINGDVQRAMFSLDNTQSDDRGTYRFVVWAKNAVNAETSLANDNADYTVSDEFLIASLPKLTLTASASDGDHYCVDLSWDDRNYKSAASAGTYKIYRKEEYGIWQLISENGTGISGSEGQFAYKHSDNSLETGTRYYYRIESSADNKTRLSDIRSIRLSNESILPGQPTGITAVRLSDSDRCMISWNAPANGGTPLKYVIEYLEDGEWHDSDEVAGTSTSLVGIFPAGYTYRLHAENDAGRGIPSEEFNVDTVPGIEDTYWPHSIRPTVTASTESDDEPWVKLSWKKDTDSGWGEALYYSIYKYDGTSYREELVCNIPVKASVNDYEWTDHDVETGGYYEYYLRPTNSWGYDDVNDYSVWAEPDSRKKSSSQIAVERVAALIDGIALPVDPEDPAVVNQVNQINEVYESLTEEQKSMVDELAPVYGRTKKLKDALDVILNAMAQKDYKDESGELVTKPVQDQIDAACNAVVNKYTSIDRIDESIFGTDDEHKALYRNIKSARAAYEELSDDAKRTVDTAQLVQIETKINSLKKEQTDNSAAQAVFTKLNALPGVTEYNSATGAAQTQIEDQTDAARRAYDALLGSQKAQLKAMTGYSDAYAKLTALETAIATRAESEEERQERERQEAADTEAAQAVDNKITALGEIDLSKKSAVQSARASYNALNSNAQKKVTKLDTLIAAENRITELEKAAADIGAAEPVAAMIDALPSVENVTLENESSVLTAQIAFDNLSEEQQALVNTIAEQSERTAKLNGLINKIGQLREAEDKRLANLVNGLISSLPGADQITEDTALQHEPAVRNARNEYNKLTQDQKRYVTTANLNKLKSVEDAIGSIKDPAAAQEVQALIDALPSADKLALSDETKLNNTAGSYYALTDKQKALVSTASVEKLGKLQERMAKLKADKAEADRRAAEEEARRAAEEEARRTAEEAARRAANAEIVDLPGVKISKPKAAKGKLTAKWKKVSKKNQKKIQGIEIHIVGPGVDRIVTAGKKKTSRKIGGLHSKQKYTVQVRTYKYVGGTKHVSAWKSKTVKVK